MSSSLNASIARVTLALARGHGRDAVQILTPLLRSQALTREQELEIRSLLAEAWLLQDDMERAATVLGRTPDTFRDTVSPGRLAVLWRLHGRIAFERGDQSRAIAHHGRALRYAESAHDSRGIGLAHYELGHCYKQVGDMPLVREHMAQAAPALHAAGDRRGLALVHSVTGVALAQVGRYDEAVAALRQAERIAATVGATDVQALVCANQANVSTLEHRYEEALDLAERSVSLHEAHGSAHGLAVALATIGQISVRLGDLTRAEQALRRALDVRTPIQFHETTGAVYDTLAQIHLIRGDYEQAGDDLLHAGDAYGAYGRQTSRWYEWNVRVLGARLALRRDSLVEAITLADGIIRAGAPPFDALQAMLVAAEAELLSSRFTDAELRLGSASATLDARGAPAAWGVYLRLRGSLQAAIGRSAEGFHDFSQSAQLLDLIGERYESARSSLALGALLARSGARSVAGRHLSRARSIFAQLGAARDLRDTTEAEALLNTSGTGEYLVSPADADDAVVRRVVDAAALPALLDREVCASIVEGAAAEVAVVYVRLEDDEVHVVAASGCDHDAARVMVRAHRAGAPRGATAEEPLGHDRERPRFVLAGSPRPFGYPALRRLRLIGAVARQGYALCAARERVAEPAGLVPEPSLEPVLPGFICASAAMGRVVEQIQRLHDNDLTVLITGESGTGKELVARAVHARSRRSGAVFLPYNCTTTGRDLADSQLFGHRRGSFTGAVSDQPGLVRAAVGGTLFLDEVGDLPLDVQPKLLRFLEHQEILPVGESRPQHVDVRVLAATNADLEQRVAEGRLREDLFYRLAVIRIHVPPLRDRREEIPHLAAYFLRDACEHLAKPDVTLSPAVLDVFAHYWWPGNARQLRNQVQRAVALSAPGGTVEPHHLSPELIHGEPGADPTPSTAPGPARRPPVERLSTAVERLERDMLRAALDRAGGNISEAARELGLTRRGLYLKLRRLGLESPGAASE